MIIFKVYTVRIVASRCFEIDKIGENYGVKECVGCF